MAGSPVRPDRGGRSVYDFAVECSFKSTDLSQPQLTDDSFGGEITSRGIMLIALAAVIHLPVLPAWQVSMLAWCIIYFVWSSVSAMLLRAISGEPGFTWAGSHTNKLVHLLYVTGTITLFAGLFLLAMGLYKALAP